MRDLSNLIPDPFLRTKCGSGVAVVQFRLEIEKSCPPPQSLDNRNLSMVSSLRTDLTEHVSA
jgi:hypothetical protein